MPHLIDIVAFRLDDLYEIETVCVDRPVAKRAVGMSGQTALMERADVIASRRNASPVAM